MKKKKMAQMGGRQDSQILKMKIVKKRRGKGKEERGSGIPCSQRWRC
jgi:hypothetical protein